MGCNCGKGTGTIGQRTQQAAFRAAGSPLGFDAASAVLVGDEADGTTWRVRVISPVVDGLSIGQAAWVKGDGVPALLEAGSLLDITRTDQKKRLFRVGKFSYTSEQEARRVSAATGKPVVEVA